MPALWEWVAGRQQKLTWEDRCVGGSGNRQWDPDITLFEA